MTQHSNPDNKVAPVLVLGATGSFAGAVAAEMMARGLPVRALVRNKQKLADRFAPSPLLEVIEGDVQNMSDLRAAARGCATIIHGVNYPYHDWFPHMETATRNILDVARENGSLIVFPGNVYSLGPADVVPFTESAPHNPITRKGELRAWMESELRAFAEEDGRVLIMRAGDYFGPTARNGYIDPMFGAAAKGKAMTVMGNLSLAHQWAYVPDLARATVELLQKPKELDAFEVVNFSGTAVSSQRNFLSDIARVAQSPDRTTRLPWILFRVLAWFSPLIREVLEMKYLWETTVLIDGPRFRELLPDFRPTPLDKAIAATVESYRTGVSMSEPVKLVRQEG